MELDLSRELLEAQTYYEDADKWRRFVNYLVDRFLSLIVTYAGILIAGFFSLLMEEIGIGALDFVVGLASIVFWWGGYPIYGAFLEHFSKGKTIGKLITQTRVVTMEGKQPSFLNLVGRNTARLIPFNAFVVLFSSDGRGLHDMVSNTRVVNDRR